MNQIEIPSNYNYIGVFLTFKCNMSCSYCINSYGKLKQERELSLKEWTEGLSRIPTRPDLPISIQGGEPTVLPFFFDLINYLHFKGKTFDILTNGKFDIAKWFAEFNPEMFNRPSKYANIRFSYHTDSDRYALASKIWLMRVMGYDVGVWALKHPTMKEKNGLMENMCRWYNIDFRYKEFLGWDNGKLYGSYVYPEALNGKNKNVLCKPSELLISPSGSIHRCHADLYADRAPVGHILDKNVYLPTTHLNCNKFGNCNPCDVKSKYNRFQELGHCSVNIKGG